MPGGDRRGPLGLGPRSGRGAGYCGGSDLPGYANPLPGRGFGMGFGRGRGFTGRGFAGRGFGGGGRGWRNGFYATGLPGWMRWGGALGPLPPADQQSATEELKDRAAALKAELDLIQQRLAESEGGAPKAR